jgi:hypothetical protein
MQARRTGRIALGPASGAVLAGCLAFFLLPFPFPVHRFDEGIQLVAATRLGAGDAAFVDYQALYPPGRSHLLAACFRVFGATYDVHAVLRDVLMALNAWAAWVAAVRLGGRRLPALVALGAGIGHFHPYPSLVLALAATLGAADARLAGRVAGFVAAGALAGLAAWFRQDVGAAATLAVAAVALAPGGAAASPSSPRAALAALASAAALFVLLLASALAQAPGAVLEGLWTNPLATLPHRQEIGAFRAYVGGDGWALVPPVVAAGGVLVALLRFRADARTRIDGVVDGPLLTGVAVLALWALRYFWLRPDPRHLVPLGILAGVFAAAAVPRSGRTRWALWAVVAIALVGPVCYRHAGARALQLLGRREPGLASLGEAVPGAQRLFLPEQEAPRYARLLERVRELAPEREPILSALARHDRIGRQDLLLHFASGRRAVVFDHHFDPGVTTREGVQRRIARDVERHGIRVVVRYASPLPPEAPGAPPGSRFLDDWLAERFGPAERHGRYEIWLRR